MKKLLLLLIPFMLCSCARFSHNVSVIAFGKKAKIGSVEYGEILYLNGFSLVDCSRENSEWEIEIDDNAGLSFDAATKTLKGVKRIHRRIGKQVTGYLEDLSKNNPDAVREYLKGDIMFAPSEPKKEKKEDDESLVKEVVKETIKVINQK
jgi:hypothetical protein